MDTLSATDLRTVTLHGGLADGPIKMSGNTIYELVEGLSRQLPSLRPNPVTGRRVLRVAGCDTEEDLHRPLGDHMEIEIYPVLEGEKGKFTQIIVGATLIALSFVAPIAGIALGAELTLGTYLAQLGTLMVLGGIAQLLAPTMEMDADNGNSRILGAPRNTAAVGTRIPVLYGEFRVGGHYLAVNVDAGKSDSTD